MKPNRTSLFLSAVVLFILAMNCECDEGGGLETAAPRADNIFVGGSEVPGSLDQFAPTPANGEIEIDFGQVDVGTREQRYLFVNNGGESDLTLTDVQIAAGTSDEFIVSCGSAGSFGACPASGSGQLSVGAGGNLVFQIYYQPRDLGPDQGGFGMIINAADHPTLTVFLRGEGVTPEIQVCASNCIGDQSGAECQAAAQVCNDDVLPMDLEVKFGDADMETSVRRRLVIRNLGQRPLEIAHQPKCSGGDFTQFSVDLNGNNLPGVLAAGQEIEIFVAYDPSLGGAHRTDLQIISNDVNEREVRVVLTGTGLAPRVCPDPYLLDFGNVSTGTPKTMSFTITNCGLLDLELLGVSMNPNSSGDFSLVDPPQTPVTLAPNDVVQVEVQYLPPTHGSDHGGVDIFSNDPMSNPASNLTGTIELFGDSVPRACDIVVTPYAVSFGGVVYNTTETTDLIVSNQGNDSCTLYDVQITENSSNNEFSILQAPAPNTEFLPGDTLLIQLQYAPTDLNVDTGILMLTGNDKDGDEIPVELNGEGVEEAACDLAVTPMTMRFGTVKVNNTQAMYLTLINNGRAPCRMSPVELVPSLMNPGDYSLTDAPVGSFDVPARGQEIIEVTFAPNDIGQHKAVVWLHTDDDPDFILGLENLCLKPGFPPVEPGPGDGCIPVSGYSAESSIEVVPAELDFGVVTVGCNSPELRVTVYNLGAETIRITDIYLENDPDPNFEIMYAPSVPYTLGGGGDFEIRLRYHPQDLTHHRTNLYIESDASNVGTLAVPLYGRGTDISDQVDVFHQPDQVKSDVLFVVDNSGSMQEEQTALADNFDAFIQHTVTLDVDFHIGVIATEVNMSETGMGTPPRDIHPGMLIQAPNRPKVIVNTTPNVEDAFKDNVSIGTCCSDEQEAGLQAAWKALSPPNVDDPAINGNFMREDAKLYIICVSDEQDQSQGDPDFYVDFFSSIKGYHNPDMMTVSAIVGDEPQGCQGNGGTAGSGSRYIDVANRTGGIFESICTSNWAQALSNLGLDAFAAIREFPLSRPADPNTITVMVNGTTIPQAGCEACADGWTYYADTNSVYFGDDYVPGQGDRIEVHYTAECL